MSDFTRTSEVLKGNNAINGISTKLNNAINVNSKYALDKTKFKPNTEETMLAEEMGRYFNDLDNYAAYLGVVNTLGPARARALWQEAQSDIKEKTGTKYEVRSPKKYFMWMYGFKYKSKY